QRAGVSVENIALKTASCTLANMDNFAFSYRKEQIDKLQFNSQKLTIDEHCFSTLPPNKQEEAVSVPVEINSLLTSIPYLSVNIENLLLKENARYQGSLQLKTQNDGRLVTCQGENAQLGIFIRDNKWLDIKQFKLNLPVDNNIDLAAEIALPIDIASLPEKGTIDATLLTSHYAYPL
ncbi:YdbH family protein, partial [Klebsiella variicola subsp. variicola]